MSKSNHVNLGRVTEIMIVADARYQYVTFGIVVDVVHAPRLVEHMLTNIDGSIRR